MPEADTGRAVRPLVAGDHGPCQIHHKVGLPASLVRAQQRQHPARKPVLPQPGDRLEVGRHLRQRFVVDRGRRCLDLDHQPPYVFIIFGDIQHTLIEIGDTPNRLVRIRCAQKDCFPGFCELKRIRLDVIEITGIVFPKFRVCEKMVEEALLFALGKHVGSLLCCRKRQTANG